MLEKSKVAVIKCEQYDRNEVIQAVRRGIDLIGGIPAIFGDLREKILLKPNALSGKVPEKCVTTHPEVFRAVATVLKEASIELQYGDSPGVGRVAGVMSKIGIKQVADELNIPLADFENGEFVSFPDGYRIKQFKIADGVRDCNAIVSLPKLKSHGLTRMTGAVKNQFGCIPGFNKPEFHVKLPNVADFSEMLVDLNLLLKPKLFIMDAIQSMEGNGPGSGEPVNTGFLLFSTDPIAIDTVACLLVNIQPDKVLTNTIGTERGLGTGEVANIEILGDNWHEMVRKDFDIDRGPRLASKSSWKFSLLRKLLTSKPVIDDKLCRRCNLCVEQCPVTPKALSWKNGDHKNPPVYDYSLCIRCYCCQEICPYGAIYNRSPLLRKILDVIYPF